MKRISALLLAILLLLTQCAVFAEETEINEEETVIEAYEGTVYEELVVGNTTAMRGEWFTELWGNSTTDIDVRELLHGYSLTTWDGNQGMFKLTPNVVTEAIVEDDEEGNRTYTLVLADDLYWSDGSAINAWDYAFSILFQIAPELYGAGAKPIRLEHLQGYEEYLNGSVGYLAGVKVPADNIISITIRAEYLPFFYEYGMLYYKPYPISEVAPGVAVKDDGDGVYLANDGAEFTSELIRSAVLDPATGYACNPKKVSGPYTLTGWDGVTATFEINPYYKGDPNGDLPTIPRLIFTLADNEDMVEKLESGEFGLLNKVTKAETIEKAMALISAEEEAEAEEGEAVEEGEEEAAAAEPPFTFQNYPRVGLSYISFSCEKAAVSSEAVRQAIAWCMDRDQIVADYTGNYGLRVDGYYGIGQWPYLAITGTLPYPGEEPEEGADAETVAAYNEALAAWDELSLDDLTVYTLDTDKAAQLLEDDGWTLNADGIREKDGVALDLTMIYPEGNRIAESFEQYLLPNLESVGIRLTLKGVPMGELLSLYYKQEDRDADMIYLATNFDVVFDPSVNFIADQEGDPNWAYTNLSDEELYEMTVDMRKTEPEDYVGYMNKWISFQERFNELLPMLPVYSNIYFDFYTSVLRNYMVPSYVTWSQAIVPAYMSDVPPVEEVEEEGEAEFEE